MTFKFSDVTNLLMFSYMDAVQMKSQATQTPWKEEHLNGLRKVQEVQE